MKRALFIMSIYAYSRELHPVVEHLAGRGYDVHVVVGWSDQTASDYAAKCESIGVTVHYVPDALKYAGPLDHPSPALDDDDSPAPIASESRVGTPARRLRARQRVGLALYSIRVFWKLVRDARLARTWAANLIDRVRADVVFGGSYRSVGTFDQGIARATRRKRILNCCIPMGPYLGQRNARTNRLHWFDVGMVVPSWLADASITNRILARLFPSWTTTRGKIRLFSFPPNAMVAAQVTGLMPANPWQQPSDDYDLCFVESDFSKQLLVESDYPEEKIVVSGKPLLDSVLQRLDDRDHMARIYSHVNLPIDSPFILFNVEPTFEHDYSSWDDHWHRFRELMNALRDTGVDVVLSLHPLCVPSNYRFVREEYGFSLAEEYKIVELFPYCALTVSFPCSTNTTAARLDVPLVIYDWLGATREETAGSERYRLPGAHLAYTFADVTKAVNELAREPDFGRPRHQRLIASRPASATIQAEIERRLDVSTGKEPVREPVAGTSIR